MPNANRTRRELRNRARIALWLAVPFAALMLLVSPRGDFPLNDDWVYAKMVRALVDDGHFGLSPIGNAFAIAQTLYAAPPVKLFGFSFTLLRLTTVFMGWLAVCFTAFTARELGMSNRAALLAALTVFVNPLFVNLSYTFMTDVPFCAFSMASVYFFVKQFRSPSIANALLATAFSIAAFYTRQFGVLIPIAFAIAALVSQRPRSLSAAVRTAGAMALPWAVALAAASAVPLPAMRVETVGREADASLRAFEFAAGGAPLALFLAGIFLLPLAACIALDALARPARNMGWRAALLPVGGIVTYFASGPALHLLAFMGPHILRFPASLGIGPPLFAEFYGPPQVDAAIPSSALVTLAIALSCLSAGTAAVAIAGAVFPRRATRAPRAGAARFLAALAMAFVAAPAFAMPGPYFDRYLLPAVPLLVLLLGKGLYYRPRTLARCGAVFVIGGLLAYSVIGLHDYMAWNTARWKAIELLRTKHRAADNEISAGFEFNGMYTSDEYLRRVRDEPGAFARMKFWAVGDTYRVSLVDLTVQFPCATIEKVPYYSWLGFGTRYVYAVRRQTPGDAP